MRYFCRGFGWYFALILDLRKQDGDILAALSQTGVGILTSATPKDTFELSVLGFVASSKLQLPFVHVYDYRGWPSENVYTIRPVLILFSLLCSLQTLSKRSRQLNALNLQP